MDFNWSELGTAVVGLVTGGGVACLALYKFVLKHKSRVAELETDVATAGAERSVADAQKLVYDSLATRLVSLEADMQRLREELAEERRMNRKYAERNQQLELHVKHLEFLMRHAGIEVPTILTIGTDEGKL